MNDEDVQWHVLKFFIDDEGSTALTARVRGSRLHIIADSTELDTTTQIGREYRELIRDIRNSETDGAAKPSPSNGTDSDSGVDIRDVEKACFDDEQTSASRGEDAQGVLQEWMVLPLLDRIDEIAPKEDQSHEQTVEEWYHTPITYWEVKPSSGGEELEAVQLDITRGLEEQVIDTIPRLSLPKYITSKADVAYYNASELIVIDASDQPIGTPYHPCRVKYRDTDRTHFLKVVDNDQPQSVKRELDILRRIQTARVHEEIRVPLLEGLVQFDDQENEESVNKIFMGFLLTDIPDPIPLTHMFDPSILQQKRDGWAKEAERMKEVLHKHNIIWGDAKADNFMVDDEDNLWIIDFGGSYTEGWIDPELNETQEGDDMGTEKVANALEDPIANVEQPEEGPPSSKDASRSKRKRHASEETGSDEESVALEKQNSKRSKQ